MDIITGILTSAVLAGGVLALAGLGEVLSERVGVFNLGLEGLMALGGVSAIMAVAVIANPYWGFVVAVIVGLLFGAIFAFSTVIVRANQILCGLALTFLGLGFANWIGKSVSGQPAQARFEQRELPLLSDIPVVGEAVFSQNVLIYFAYLLLPVAMHYLLFKTRHGINLRAVGENPAAADAMGISVVTIRFVYVSVGSSLAAAAGAYLTLAFVPAWSEGITAGRGWIAIALVIFAGYRPLNVTWGALLFGIITAFGYLAQARNWAIPSAFFSMLPYLGTIAFLLVPVLVWKQLQRRMAAPAALGEPYYREER